MQKWKTSLFQNGMLMRMFAENGMLDQQICERKNWIKMLFYAKKSVSEVQVIRYWHDSLPVQSGSAVSIRLIAHYLSVAKYKINCVYSKRHTISKKSLLEIFYQMTYAYKETE